MYYMVDICDFFKNYQYKFKEIKYYFYNFCIYGFDCCNCEILG